MPLAGEVLVKTRACGICGSDLHAARHTEAFVNTSREAGGAFKLTTFDPVVLGHEFSAEIVDYGPNTPHDLAVGTVVCSVPMLARQNAAGGRLFGGNSRRVRAVHGVVALAVAAGAGRHARYARRVDGTDGSWSARGEQGAA